MAGIGPYRAQRKIAVTDVEFSVRLASLDDLKRILGEAKKNQWSAVWSSEEALIRQVDPDSLAIVCPLLRNGAPIDEPQSFRCHVWFVHKESRARMVSLLDVGERMMSALREAAEPADLKKVIRFTLDGIPLEPLD